MKPEKAALLIMVGPQVTALRLFSSTFNPNGPTTIETAIDHVNNAADTTNNAAGRGNSN